MSPPTADAGYLAALVRTADRPRYYATLFAPETCRADLFALYGFAAEIERVPDQVRDPRLGEIRLQWWLDALDAAVATGGSGEAPAVRALAATIRRRSLPMTPIRALIEARRADLYADPPTDRGDLEGRLGETESAVFQLAALILGSHGPETADASGHAGIAYGLARRLARFGEDRARGRTILPLDLLAAEGLGAAEIFSPAAEPVASRLRARTADIASEHLRLARRSIEALPPGYMPAFLPLAVAAPLIARTARMDPSLAGTTRMSDLGSLARITWAWLRWSRRGGGEGH